MSSNDRFIPRPEEIRDSANEIEPLVDTPLIDMWCEADLPFRGERRQNMVERLRAQLRGRRTADGIAERLSRNITQPVTSAIDDEVKGRARGRIRKRIEDRVEDAGGQ